MSSGMMTGVTAILGAGGGGGGGGLSGVNTLLLNGSDQYATVPYDPSLDVSNEATVSIWVAPANQGGDQVLVSNTNELLNAGFEIRYNGSTKKITVFARISGTNYTLESNASLQVDTFSHVAFTYDTSDDLKLYIDGSLDNTLSQGSLINLSTYDIGIGARKTTLSAELFFSGSLALPVIENASRDLAGIQELATPKDPSLYTQTNMVMGLPLNAGSATPTTDTTANANDATLQGATTPDYTGIKLPIEQASGGGGGDIDAGSYNDFAFDATDDRLYSSDSGLNYTGTTLSLSFWLKTGSNISSQQLVLGNGIGGSTGYTVFIWVNELRVYKGSSQINSISITFSANTEYHFTVVADGSTWKLYHDNTEIASTANGSSILSATQDFYVGYNTNGSIYSDMQVSNVAVSGQAFDSTAISELYNSGTRPRWSTLSSGTQSQIDHFWYLNSGDDSGQDKAGSIDLTKEGGVGATGTSYTWS